MADSFEAVRTDQKQIREDMAAAVDYLGKLVRSQPFMDMSPRNVRPDPEQGSDPVPVVDPEPERISPPPPVFRNGRSYV